MVRNKLKQKTIENSNGDFRFRGTDNTRIEAYSDGVFAIATALLIISTSVPETYAELLLFLEDMIPFAICITLLIMIWHEHYIFFIRYGFKDAGIVAINTLFLFLVLFYIYPLKFLFSLLYKMMVGVITNDVEEIRYLFSTVIDRNDTPVLMVIYGLGAAAVFLTLTWMYVIAYLRRHKLALNELEIYDTRLNIIENLAMASVPIISSIMALSIDPPMRAFKYSGLFYWSYAVIMPVLGYIMYNKRKKLVAKLSGTAQISDQDESNGESSD